MSITAARLQAEVGGDTKGFDTAMAHADTTIQRAPSKWSTALKIGAGAALAAGGALVVRGAMGAISDGLAGLREDSAANAQTAAAIKSTGGAAHVTAAQIDEMSNALKAKVAVDEVEIKKAANLMLTFTNVRNEAGAGNDVFNQSVAVMADMSRAMGTDVAGGAIQLGKALNDPIKGITALTRVGVTFSADQQAQIKDLVKHNDLLGAQKIILAELNKEFGGSGAMFAASDAGKAEAFAIAVDDIKKAFASGMLPAIGRVQGALTAFLTDPATMGQITALGDSIASIFSEGNIRTAASLMTTAAGAVGTAIKMFSALPPEVQALAVGALGLKKITGIGPTDILKAITGGKGLFSRGSSPASPMYVSQVGGGALGGAAGTGGGALGAVMKVALVAVAAGVAVELAGALGQQSTDIQKQGADLVALTDQNAPKMTRQEITAALAQIDEQKLGGFGLNALALTVMNPFNHGLDNLAATEKKLQAQLDAMDTSNARGGQGTSGRGIGPDLGKAVRDQGWVVDNAIKTSWKDAAATIVHAIGLGALSDATTLRSAIVARSAAEHGGTSLGPAAVTATLSRDLLHKADAIARSGHTQAEKVTAIEALQRTATQAGIPKTNALLGAVIQAVKHPKPAPVPKPRPTKPVPADPAVPLALANVSRNIDNPSWALTQSARIGDVARAQADASRAQVLAQQNAREGERGDLSAISSGIRELITTLVNKQFTGVTTISERVITSAGKTTVISGPTTARNPRALHSGAR